MGSPASRSDWTADLISLQMTWLWVGQPKHA